MLRIIFFNVLTENANIGRFLVEVCFWKLLCSRYVKTDILSQLGFIRYELKKDWNSFGS